MLQRTLYRPIIPFSLAPCAQSFHIRRWASRYEAFDSGLDEDELCAARTWRQTLSLDVLPRGTTTFSRSSGPGGQHVNKTETKATTFWAARELTGILPKLLHDKIRLSRYYVKKTDSITLQAQTQRSRDANTTENRQKLYEEILKMYDETVPSQSSPEKSQKYKAVEKAFHRRRLEEKKRLSSKKQSRRGFDL